MRLNKPSVAEQAFRRGYRNADAGIPAGISESYTCKLVHWAEQVWIESGEFSLPGKKVLYGDDEEASVVLIDATETPIQRPQKNKDGITQAKRNGS